MDYLLTSMKILKTPPAPPGRPRAFDMEVALDSALRVFWEKGYEGASLADLTAAMGINRPSLYSAFGNKEALFRKVMDRYAAGPASFFGNALEAPTARAVAEQLLRGAVEAQCHTGHPRGCMAVQSALVCGDEALSVRAELTARRAAAQQALRERLERAKADGDLPRTADPAALAQYLAAVVQGLAVQASSGASRAELAGVAEMALKAWPK